MKKFKLIMCLLTISLAAMVQSCSTEGYEDPVQAAPGAQDLSWKATTKLQVEAVKDKGNFIWEKNLLTSAEYWSVSDVQYNVKINSAKPLNISKIEFYMTMQEKDGYNYSAPFDYKDHLAATISSWDKDGNFKLTFNVINAYNFFKSNLKFDRSTKLGRVGDLFEIHWVIYGPKGEILDSRENSTAENRFSFTTKFLDFAPPVLAGTYNCEWIAATAPAVSYGRIAVGQKFSYKITQVEGQTYAMDNLMFGYFYAKAGQIKYDFLSGLITIVGTQGEKWKIINVNGATMDIALEYKYSASYNEYCTVRVTRTDGTNWPSNIRTQ